MSVRYIANVGGMEPNLAKNLRDIERCLQSVSVPTSPPAATGGTRAYPTFTDISGKVNRSGDTMLGNFALTDLPLLVTPVEGTIEYASGEWYLSVPDAVPPNTFIDPRDGESYHTVVIDGKTWLAENFRGDFGDNQAFNLATYGRLYAPASAIAQAPTGWHLPTKLEMEALVTFCGGLTVAGKALKANDPLWTINTGTDDYGFGLLPCGSMISNAFGSQGDNSYLWTSTVGTNSGEHWECEIYGNSDTANFYSVVDVYTATPVYFGVRYIKD